MGNCMCSGEEGSNYPTNNDMDSVITLDIHSDTPTDDNASRGESLGGMSNISFERESVVSKLEHIYIEDEMCAVCSYSYDEDEHLPRILPCGHTICYYCIRQIAKENKFKYLKCPLDRQHHRIKQRHTDRSQLDCTTSLYEESDTVSNESQIHNRIDETDDLESSLGQIDLNSTTSLGSFESLSDIIPLTHLHFMMQNERSAEYGRHRMVNNSYSVGQIDNVQLYSYTENEGQENRASDPDAMDMQYAMLFRKAEPQMTNSPRLLTRHQSFEEIRTAYHKRSNVYPFSFRGYSDIKTDQGILRAETEKTERDIYDDERSIRSFEWVEPDYSSGSEKE